MRICSHLIARLFTTSRKVIPLVYIDSCQPIHLSVIVIAILWVPEFELVNSSIYVEDEAFSRILGALHSEG